MDINLASFLMLASILAGIATIVLFLIACTSQNPFNMNSRTEGLLVAGVLCLIGIWFSGFAAYAVARVKAPEMPSA